MPSALLVVACVTPGLSLGPEMMAAQRGVSLRSNLAVSTRTAAIQCSGRRTAISSTAALLLSGCIPSTANALIKGSAPPPKMSGPKERKCKSIDECEALGEAARKSEQEGADTTILRTTGGDRYRDLQVGEGKTVASGDTVDIRYRVMRLGPKARDGLSGEGQTIFSFGYGEDEDNEGDTLPVKLSGRNLVPGVNDALLGMQPGGRRRVLVRPERGWRELTGACADGEKSLGLEATKRTSAQDGNLVFKADIGAAIESETACQNKVSQPQPKTYGAKARFGRRFDESLLVELDVVSFTDPKKAQKGVGGLALDPKVDRCRCVSG